MVEFLRLSPSYELARKYRAKGLQNKAFEWMPADFDQVLKTYDEFGDVANFEFEDWWEAIGIGIYGSQYDRPKVWEIIDAKNGELHNPLFTLAYEHYFKEIRPHEGNLPTLVLAIPLGLSKRYVMQQISSHIDRVGVEVQAKTKRSPRPFAAERIRGKPLIRAIHLLRLKAEIPEIELWRLGVLCDVSPKNSIGLDAMSQKNTTQTADQRIKMAVLTSRALKNAKYVCENAARGKFPSNAPLEIPEFEYADIGARIEKMRFDRKSNG